MDRESSRTPLFRLEYLRSDSGGIYYLVTIDGCEDDRPGQIVFFNSSDYAISFIEPHPVWHRSLAENEKWLRSILYTTLKIKKPETISIPFTFPDEDTPAELPDKPVRVYCDGSCGEAGSGGWGGVILTGIGDTLEVSGEEDNSTSNRMELLAAVNTLLKTAEIIRGEERPVLLLSDSRYVVLGITCRLNLWQRNGFITSLGTPVVNRELWEQMADIIGTIQLHCARIESGKSDQYHRRCHELASMRMRREVPV